MAIGNAIGIPFRRILGGIPFKSDAARWVKFDANSLTYIDQIGDETRPLQPDYCITGDTVNTITFPAAVDQIKYIDNDGTVSSWQSISGAWTIPSVDIMGIILSDGLSRIGYLPCQEKDGLTLFDVEGGYHSTLSSDTVRGTTLTDNIKNWNNAEGWNKAAYFNGLNAKITYSPTIRINNGDTFSCDYILNENISGVDNYQFSILKTDGVVRLSGVVFRENSGLFQINVIYSDESGFSNFQIPNTLNYHTTEKLEISIVGTVLYVTFQGVEYSKDFGVSIYIELDRAGEYNGGQFYHGLIANIKKNGIAIDALNGSTTGIATNVDFDSFLIPNDLNNEGFDIFDRESLYSGIAKMNVYDKGSNVLDFDPTDAESIGEIAFIFFNGLATVGNALNLPEIHPAGILAYVDASDPYDWNEDMIDYLLDNEASYPAAYQGYIYLLYKTDNNLNRYGSGI
jgi:hypothetical protein